MHRPTRLVMLTLIGLVLAACATGTRPSSSVSDHHWVLVEPPTDSRLRITADIGSSSCESFDQVIVAEDDTTVDLRVRVRANGAEVCTADLRTQELTVDLAAPLGSRELTGCRPVEIAPGVTDPEGCRRIEPRLPR